MFIVKLLKKAYNVLFTPTCASMHLRDKEYVHCDHPQGHTGNHRGHLHARRMDIEWDDSKSVETLFA